MPFSVGRHETQNYWIAAQCILLYMSSAYGYMSADVDVLSRLDWLDFAAIFVCGNMSIPNRRHKNRLMRLFLDLAKTLALVARLATIY